MEDFELESKSYFFPNRFLGFFFLFLSFFFFSSLLRTAEWMPADQPSWIFSPIFLIRMLPFPMRRGDRGRNKSMLQQKNRPRVKSAGPVFLSEKIRRASVLCPEDEV